MNKYQPALLGGLFIGVLSSLPYVNLGNCCCCLWVVSGGVLVTYLLQERQQDPVEASRAALMGLLAGLIGGVICMALNVMLHGMDPATLQEGFRRAIEENPRSAEIPPWFREWFSSPANARLMATIMILGPIPIFAVVSMLGSLLGAAFFTRKRKKDAEQSS